MNPGTAVAGQNAAFSVTVTEPDHGLSNACGTLDFGDGVSSGTCQEPPCSGKYGPWTPPTPPAGGTRTFSFQHTYAAPGAYTVIFKIESRDNCEDPYGTRYGLTFTRWNIVVAATPTGT